MYSIIESIDSETQAAWINAENLQLGMIAITAKGQSPITSKKPGFIRLEDLNGNRTRPVLISFQNGEWVHLTKQGQIRIVNYAKYSF